MMNAAFLVLAALTVVHYRVVGVAGWDWLGVLLLVVAAVPAALTVRVFELRFKMAAAEHAMILHDLPARRKRELVAYGVLAAGAIVWQSALVLGAMWGVWLRDFFTYYHDRPERMRHLYAVTLTADELRSFPLPWLWPVPSLVYAAIRAAIGT